MFYPKTGGENSSAGKKFDKRLKKIVYSCHIAYDSDAAFENHKTEDSLKSSTNGRPPTGCGEAITA